MALLLALRQASPLQAAGRLAPALLASSLQQIRGLAAPSNQMALIKELRERTGSPIGDVKKCLESCGWDLGEKMRMRRAACERSGWTSCSDRCCRRRLLPPPPLPPAAAVCCCRLSSLPRYLVLNGPAEAATAELRKRGLAAASKKASRHAAEGLVGVAQGDGAAAVVEVRT